MTTNYDDGAGNPPTTSESLRTTEREMGAMEADIAKLATILSQESGNHEDDADVSALLARLENVDGMAQGVENKLDGLLEKLDGLLTSLETKRDGTTSDTTITPSVLKSQ